MHLASFRISPPFPHAAAGRLVLSPVAPPTPSGWVYDRRRLLGSASIYVTDGFLYTVDVEIIGKPARGRRRFGELGYLIKESMWNSKEEPKTGKDERNWRQLKVM